jgi:hypothetical protein
MEPSHQWVELLQGLTKTYARLTEETCDRFIAAESEIAAEALRLETQGLRACMRELSDEYILIFERAPPHQSYVQVGFPFPLVERNPSTVAAQNCSVRLCIRGEAVRSAQREVLRKAIGYPIVSADANSFSRLCRELARAKRYCLYINPYTFLGDSIIGEHFRRRVVDAFEISTDGYYSRFDQHLAVLGDARPLKEAVSRVTSNHLVVMPDLIDTHFSATLEILPKMLAAGATVLLVGRNIAIDPETRRFHWHAAPDPLLRASNIEDYMEDCLYPFVGRQPDAPRTLAPQLDPPQQQTILINPFASLCSRDLPVRLVVDFVAALGALGVKRVLISRGAPGIDKDARASAAIARALAVLSPSCAVEQRAFDDLSHMTRTLREECVTLGITPDTSVPHMFNAAGLRTLTLYNVRFWDAACLQSLASDSPLGFCRYGAGQLPFLFDAEAPPSAETLKHLLKALLASDTAPTSGTEAETLLREYRDAVMAVVDIVPTANLDFYFDDLAHMHARLARMFELADAAKLFPPEYFRPWLLGSDRSDTRRLVHSLFRISPVFKIAEARHGAAQS